MDGQELKELRRSKIRLTQKQLSERLGTTRQTIARYELGTHKIPGAVALAIQYLTASSVPLLGTVAAGNPIEPIPQAEVVEVPQSMVKRKNTFALRVKGESMKEEGILPGDIVIVEKHETARNGEIIIALINGEATIKKFFRKSGHIELQPAHAEMAPITVAPTDRFEIIGIVVGLTRHM